MLLTPMLSRLSLARNLDETLRFGLRDFIALHGAEMGDLQLLGRDDALLIVAERGLSCSFLQTFERVSTSSSSACGRAARDGQPVFIADVGADADYAPYHAFAASVPFCTVLSCPLVDCDGELVGMLSALSAQPFQPTPLELSTATAYCSHLADTVAALLPPDDLRTWAEARSRSLQRTMPSQRGLVAPLR